jgi:UDP-glucose 4-epimerase
VENVLITGICGAQARVVANLLCPRVKVCGVDKVEWRDAPRGVTSRVADLRKRSFEDVVRTERPDSVVHLGFIRHFAGDARLRHDVNVRGTQRLLEHCVKYGVKRLVVVSSSYVYGAFPENPFNLTAEAPLSASRSYPEIRDLVEVDSLTTSFLWKERGINTSVLRPVNVIGRSAQSMAARYLRLARIPTVMGFDPMMQFIHEEDVALAIEHALDADLRGVFNVTGPGEVPVHTAIRETGGVAWPVPEPLLRSVLGAASNYSWLLPGSAMRGLSGFPKGILDYLKYPVTLGGEPFREATGFKPRYELYDAFQSQRRR